MIGVFNKDKVFRVLDNLIIASACAFVIFSPFRRMSKGFLILVASFWFIQNFVRHGKAFYKFLIPQTILYKPFLIFLLALVVSTMFSLDNYASQQIFCQRYLYFMMFFLIGGLADNKRKVFVFIGAAILGSFIISIGGIWDYLNMSSEGRLYTIFGKSPNLTSLVTLYFPLVFSIGFFAKHKALKLAGLLSTLLLFPCLVWNASRTAWLAVPVTVFFISFIKNKKLVFCGIIFLIIVSLFLSPRLKHRISAVHASNDWLVERMEMNKVALGLFEDFPVFGSGLGMVEKNWKLYSFDESQKYIHPDNTYTELLAEVGLVGFVSFLWIFVVFFKESFKSIKQNVGNYDIQAIRLGLMGAIFASLILGLATNNFTVGLQNTAVLWFLLGLASGKGIFSE